MIISLIIGILVGFVLAIAPGPVSVSTMKTGIERGFASGVKLAAGAGLLDVIYCSIAMLAASAMITAIKSFFANHPVATIFFQFLCVAVLLIYGIVHIKSKKTEIETSIPKSGILKFLDNLKNDGPFLLGLAIALTNLANPTFFAALTYIALIIKHMSLIGDTILDSALFSLGFGLGNFLWLYVILKVVGKFRDKLSNAVLTKINHFAGATMIGIGALYGYRIIALTKWSEILHLAFAF